MFRTKLGHLYVELKLLTEKPYNDLLQIFDHCQAGTNNDYSDLNRHPGHFLRRPEHSLQQGSEYMERETSSLQTTLI
jgi:hypothetical protein